MAIKLQLCDGLSIPLYDITRETYTSPELLQGYGQVEI
jgi:hypothetical protein